MAEPYKAASGTYKPGDHGPATLPTVPTSATMSSRHQLFLLATWFLLLAGFTLPLARAHAAATAPQEPPRRLQVMFFGAPTANGPHHDPITRFRVLQQAFGTEGIDLTYLEDPAVAFTAPMLAQFDAVLMYGNWDMTGPMPRQQLLALLAYVDGGGGFVPVHCASACFGGSPLFVRLVGARFASHGGQEFAVENVRPEHPILRGLPGYTAWDETYLHSDHGDDREILQVHDGEPWSWTRTHGQGRVFYTASGHDHRVWDLPAFQQLLRNAIVWAVGPDKAALLQALALPKLTYAPVSLPGYRDRREITVAQQPLPPLESQKLAQVPVGMELALFASEPDIVNPIHVAFDHRGRAFVTETIDYPNNLHAGQLGHDRITICEDHDGDGKADHFTRFAEGLSIPTSLTFALGGVICSNGHDMLFLADTDGDDKADVRRVLFTGFRMGDTHAGVSNLRHHHDGWVYATIGYDGFAGEVGGVHHDFGQAVFRFRPDGSALEVLQHTTNNTWGLGFTEAGDLVGSTANANPSWYLTFPARAYAAAGLDQPSTPAADDNPLIYPRSFDLRQVDQFDRYTAAAGHAVYTARRFPSEYHDHLAFVCEPTGKLVGRFALERTGAGFRAVQSPNNLYASADAWSAPVCCEVGPDGALWICDWYNLIVQHNPTPTLGSAGVEARTGRGNAYETPLRDTRHGRIWRVFPRGSANDVPPRLDAGEADSLLAGLDHTNLLWRDHAARLLVEHPAGLDIEGVVAQLERRATAGGLAAPFALAVLAQTGRLSPALLRQALRADDAATRRAAVTIAAEALLVDELAAAYVQDGQIRATGRELAEVLVGFARAAADPTLGAAIWRVARNGGEALFAERAMRDAWTMAAVRQAAGVLAAAAADGVRDPAPEPEVNLLPNPGFEQVQDGQVVGWTELRTYGGASGPAVTFGAAPNGRGGGQCLFVRCERFSDSGIACRVRLEAGARYRLSGWLRTEGALPAGDAPGMMLNVHGGPHTRGLCGDQDWTELTLEFEADGGEQIVHCLFGGYGGARGTAFFDDLRLVKVRGGFSLAHELADLRRHRAADAAVASAVRTFGIDAAVHARGRAVYQRTCVTCHGIDGKGSPGAFPPLDGSDWLTGDATLPARIVLHGLFGEVHVKGQAFTSAMPPLGPTLTDQEIADVLTLVRQSWSNDAAQVTAEQVAATRKAHADRALPWTARELGR